MSMTQNGISTTATGEEQYEEFMAMGKTRVKRTACYVIRWQGRLLRVRATHAQALALAGLLLNRRRAA